MAHSGGLQYGALHMATDDRDRRRFQRLSVDLRVRVLTEVAGKSAMSYGRGHDLSESGMAVYVPLELKVGQEIRVEFEVPLARVKFGVRGLVRSVRSYRYGIEFLYLTSQESQELKRSLEVIALIASTKRPAQ